MLFLSGIYGAKVGFQLKGTECHGDTCGRREMLASHWLTGFCVSLSSCGYRANASLA